jgi:hypothetical protein
MWAPKSAGRCYLAEPLEAGDARRPHAVAWLGGGPTAGRETCSKQRDAPDRPRLRATGWLEAKQRPELVVDVLYTGDRLIQWGGTGAGRWCSRCAYTHPRTGERVTVEQAVRLVSAGGVPLLGPVTIRCWGVRSCCILSYCRLPETLCSGYPGLGGRVVTGLAARPCEVLARR